MSELKFNRTLSTSQFCKEVGASTLNVVKNPNTGKLFFTTDVAGTTGKVSNKFDANNLKNLAISECSDEEGVTFWMLHYTSEVNVVATISLAA